jgi:hypothetical protein
MRSFLQSKLNIKPGEERGVFLLFLHSVFTGFTKIFYINAATTLFVANMGKEGLSIAFILSALVGTILGFVYKKLLEKYSLKKTLSLNLYFLIASLSILLFFLVENDNWIIFTMFVFMQPLSTFLYMEFWSLAGKIYNIRETKRLIGVFSSGETLIGILACFSISFILILFNDNVTYLFYISYVSLIVCLILFKIISNYFDIDKTEDVVEETTHMTDRLGSIIKVKYIQHMLVITTISTITYYFLEFAFLDELKLHFKDETGTVNVFKISAFLSIFQGFSRLLEFIVKSFVFSRFIQFFGVRGGMLALPLTFVFSLLIYFGLLLIGLDENLIKPIFVVLVMMKFTDIFCRKSMYDSSFRILYQIMPEKQNLRVQTLIDGIYEPLLGGISGVLLLLLGVFDVDSELMLFIVSFFVVIWIVDTYLLSIEYKKTLLINLKEIQKQSEEFYKSTASLYSKIIELPQKEFVKIFRVLKRLFLYELGDFFIQVIKKKNPEKIAFILNEIKKEQYYALKHDLINNLNDYLTEEDIDDLSHSVSVKKNKDELLNSSSRVDRFTAINLALNSKINLNDHEIELLLKDESEKVRRRTFKYIADNKRVKFLPVLLNHYVINNNDHLTQKLILQFDKQIIDTVISYADERISSVFKYNRLIYLIGKIGGETSKKYLFDNLNIIEGSILNHILQALINGDFKLTVQEKILLDFKLKETIESLSWKIASVLDLSNLKESEQLVDILFQHIDLLKSRKFSLLCIRYDSKKVSLIQDIIQNESISNDIALELFDSFINKQHKKIILPVLDDLSLVQKLKRLHKYFPQERLSIEMRLHRILESEYSKCDVILKSWALKILLENYSNFKEKKLLLKTYLNHPVESIREIILKHFSTLNPEEFQIYINESKNSKLLIESLKRSREMELIERTRVFKTSEYFKHIPDDMVSEKLSFSEIEVIEKGERIITEGNNDSDVYYIVNGTFNVFQKNKKINIINKNEIVGEMAGLTASERNATIVAREESKVIRLKGNDFFELISNQIEYTNKLLKLIINRSFNSY